jgi:hypothetical protein
MEYDRWWQNGQPIRLPVPLSLIEEWAGGRDASGAIRIPMVTDARPRLVLPLRLGDHDLGMWQVMGDVDAEIGRDHAEYWITLRPVV